MSDEWQRNCERKRAVQNLFYACLFALAGVAVVFGLRALINWLMN